MRILLATILVLVTHISFANEYIVRTKETGFYKISKSDINKLNLSNSQIALNDLSLKSSEGELPFFFTTGQTQLAGNDDLIFFAEALKGKHSKQHALDDDNGFSLSQSKQNSEINDWHYDANAFKNLQTCEKVYSQNHYEANKLLIRVNHREYKQTPELWYWEKLNQLKKKGFTVPFEVNKYNGNSDLKLTAAFRSRNKDKRTAKVHDHEIQIFVNDVFLDSLKWDGKIQHISDKINIPKDLIKAEDNTITFKVPKRKIDNKNIIDFSLLDFFKIDYEIDQSKITASDPLKSDVKCKLDLSNDQFAYSTVGNKMAFDAIEINPESAVYVGDKNQLKTPGFQRLKPIVEDLSETEYLMITHPLFRESLDSFADYYNNKGIKSTIIDTEQIYQNYSHGVRELESIKQLISDTHKKSNGKLTYVLLVGDSSWDWRDYGQQNQYGKWANKRVISNGNFTNFPHQESYTEKYSNRDFVPTGQYHSSQGHSASDNWFASFIPEENETGEDFIPDVAIGRFPVSTPEELDAMIAKTINYTKNTKVGPWKSRILWITNANRHFQKRSVVTSNAVGDLGVSAQNVFPQGMDGDNLKVQQTLTDSFDEGNLVVHFMGHGGKSIWRVGPPDLKKNRDLFTLDHVSQLNNAKNLPFVMSMSCYSAPFDHPFADSIGEKFIREPDVGAVAVLASSWRNTPNSKFSQYILENIFKYPENSVGQAVLAGKRHFRGESMVKIYNLLGDPAVRLAVPSLTMENNFSNNQLTASIDSKSFKGKAKIELIDEKSNVLSSHEIDVTDNTFSFQFDGIPDGCNQGRVYAWDTEQNIDAMTAFNCTVPKNL
ncbi:MAG: C25 family cysteine peptidase [Marinicellaceae bacterium]